MTYKGSGKQPTGNKSGTRCMAFNNFERFRRYGLRTSLEVYLGLVIVIVLYVLFAKYITYIGNMVYNADSLPRHFDFDVG